MEAPSVNLVDQDDPPLILANGVLGMRMQDLLARPGAQDCGQFGEEYPVKTGSELGPLPRQTWRPGPMGHSERDENVDRVIEVLEETM